MISNAKEGNQNHHRRHHKKNANRSSVSTTQMNTNDGIKPYDHGYNDPYSPVDVYHYGDKTYNNEKSLTVDNNFADQLRYNQAHEPDYNPKTDIEKKSEVADICATYKKCVDKNGADACQAFKTNYC